MSKSVVLLLVLVLTASSIVTFLPVKGEYRTIVVPDDYPTIRAAVGNATDGDTIFVKAGTYEEKPLKTNKTLSLIGEGADSTKISFDPPYTWVDWNILQKTKVYQNPIEVNADHFQLSGFTIVTTGGRIGISGNGTKIAEDIIFPFLGVSGSYLNITGNSFPNGVSISGDYSKISANAGFSMSINGTFCDFSLNRVSGSDTATGIRFKGSFCLVHDNTLTHAPYGRFSTTGKNNSVYRNIVDGAAFGLVAEGSNNSIYANRITNCDIGIENPASSNIIYANYVAGSGWGVNTYDGSIATFYHNNFVGSRYQVCTILNEYTVQYFDNGSEGNYWSDYTGIDADGDGIGDTPYVIDDNRSDRYPFMAPFDIDSVAIELPEWATPPSVRLISPENTTYTSENVTLEFTVNKQTTWMASSLDGQETVTVIGNITLIGLSNGLHNVTVYAKDALENMGNSETTYFSVEVPEPFPTTLVATTAIASGAVVGVALLVYFKKRRREAALYED
jgi:nitrous oxidase accessory protein